jgi:hypothetical protein
VGSRRLLLVPVAVGALLAVQPAAIGADVAGARVIFSTETPYQFDLRGRNLYTYTADARPWLAASRARYDAIFLDAYRQPYIPFYLVTREFFALIRPHLRPGGTLIINVGHIRGSDSLEKAVSTTLRAEFPVVLRDVFSPTNSLLIASTEGCPARGSSRRTPCSPQALTLSGRRTAGTGAARRLRLHRRPGPGRVAHRLVDLAVRERAQIARFSGIGRAFWLGMC